MGVEDEGIIAPTETPAPTKHEERASEDGWRPETEWEGDPEDWVTAREFNFRGELMGRISQQGRKLSTLEADNATLNKLVRSNSDVTRQMTEKAYKKAVRDLRADKADALREGDHERVMDIDDAVDDLKEARDKMTEEPEQSVDAPLDRSQWTPQQNAWFEYARTTPELQDATVFEKTLKYADELLDKESAMPVGKFIGKLNSFAEGGTRTTAPAGPDDGAGGRKRAPARSGKFTAKDLDQMELDMAKEFVATGGADSVDEYAATLGKGGNLQSQQR